MKVLNKSDCGIFGKKVVRLKSDYGKTSVDAYQMVDKNTRNINIFELKIDEI